VTIHPADDPFIHVFLDDIEKNGLSSDPTMRARQFDRLDEVCRKAGDNCSSSIYRNATRRRYHDDELRRRQIVSKGPGGASDDEVQELTRITRGRLRSQNRQIIDTHARARLNEPKPPRKGPRR
jgi:hypothetical protein